MVELLVERRADRLAAKMAECWVRRMVGNLAVYSVEQMVGKLVASRVLKKAVLKAGHWVVQLAAC
jgi:hypothetical protein